MSEQSIQWVGHRGLPAAYPENSLAGLRQAVVNGAAGVEFDVQLSRDGIPVILHDESLLRTTGRQGSVHEYSASELAALSAGEPQRFGSQFEGETIPLLQDAVKLLIRHPQVTVFVELKEEPLARVSRKDYIQAVWPLLAVIARQCVIISFDLALIREIQSLQLCRAGWVLSHYDLASLMRLESQGVDFVFCNYKKFPAEPAPLWSGKWEWAVYDVTDAEALAMCKRRNIRWIETWDLNLAHQL